MNAGEVFHGSTMTISIGAKPGLKGKSMIAGVLADYLESLTNQDILLAKASNSATSTAPTASSETCCRASPGMGVENLTSLVPDTASGVFTLRIPDRSRQTSLVAR